MHVCNHKPSERGHTEVVPVRKPVFSMITCILLPFPAIKVPQNLLSPTGSIKATAAAMLR